MTPNVQRAVQFYPERAADYKWFDIGRLPEGREFSHEEIVSRVIQPLPFDKCALAGIDIEDTVFAVLVTKGTEEGYETAILIETTVQQSRNSKKGYVHASFWVRPTEVTNPNSDMELQFLDPRFNNDQNELESSRMSAMVIAIFMEMVHKENESYKLYTAAPKSSNPKRIRQGKMPLFDWHTVIIDKAAQKLPHQGGTHSSPRLHDVRGHWVNRNGKRYWRKAHQRGDASLGVVFHDYKLKGEVK